MTPANTVEDYLKAIVLGQAEFDDDQRLVPMEDVARAVGVGRAFMCSDANQ